MQLILTKNVEALTAWINVKAHTIINMYKQTVFDLVKYYKHICIICTHNIIKENLISAALLQLSSWQHNPHKKDKRKRNVPIVYLSPVFTFFL